MSNFLADLIIIAIALLPIIICIGFYIESKKDSPTNYETNITITFKDKEDPKSKK